MHRGFNSPDPRHSSQVSETTSFFDLNSAIIKRHKATLDRSLPPSSWANVPHPHHHSAADVTRDKTSVI